MVWTNLLGQFLLGGLLLVVLPLVFFVLPILIWRGRIRRRGYPGLGVYLRELPGTDAERLEAVELSLQGAMLCLLGLLFPPILIIGLVPLYFGLRKLAAVRLGIKSLGEDQAAERLL